MRKALIAGNWKMNGTREETRALIHGINQGIKGMDSIDVLVCPSFIHLAEAKQLANTGRLLIGAQNCHQKDHGAYTGEVSAPMLADMGCQYVLVGHSERRHLFHEDPNLVAEKFKAAIAAKLTPILCVGETAAERKANETEKTVQEQIDAVIRLTGIEAFKHAVIAYEPVWAIGTGLTATPEQAQKTHAFIRNFIAQNNVDIGNTIRILYGGSMKADNAAQLLAMPDIDGGLIGGASLDANSFVSICRIAAGEGLTAKTG